MARVVEIAVVVKHVTARAALVNFGVREEVWVPLSQIEDFVDPESDRVSSTTESIFIPEWLATEKGMV